MIHNTLAGNVDVVSCRVASPRASERHDMSCRAADMSAKCRRHVTVTENKDLNSLSSLIKKFSEDMPIIYGLFSIFFAVRLGIASK